MFNKITPIFHNLFQKVKTKRTIPDSFYETIPVSKSKTLQKRKLQTSVSLTDTRILDKILTNNAICKELYTMARKLHLTSPHM